MPASPSLSWKKDNSESILFKDSNKIDKTRPSVNYAKGWLDQSFLIPGLVVWSTTVYLTIFDLVTNKRTNDQTLPGDLSASLHLTSEKVVFCKKKDIYAGLVGLAYPSLPCFCVTFEYIKGDFVTYTNNLILSHLNTRTLFFVTFEHLKASFVTRKCKKCDIVWNVTRHLPLQMLRLENRGRQLTICIMSLPPRKPNLKYQKYQRNTK